MKDSKKTKEQLVNELVELRQRIAELEKSEAQRKQAKKALKDSEARYKALFDRTLFCVYVHDFEGRFIDANQAALNLLGYTKKDIPSLDFSSLIGKDQISVALADIEEVKQTGSNKQSREYKLRKKDGGYVWVETEASLIYRKGKPFTIQGIARDITERKQAERALNESEQKLRNIIEHSNEIFYVHDSKHKLTYVSPQSLQILEYTPDEMMTEWTNLVTENPINKIGIGMTNKALETGQRQMPYSLELYRKDGGRVWLEIDESPYKDEAGNVIGIVGAARDVTGRKKIEEALRESEEKFRILAETNAAAIVIYHVNKLQYVNPATEALTGYTKEELLKINFWDLIHPDFREWLKEREFARLRGENIDPLTEFKIITKGGKMRWLTATSGIIEIGGTPSTIGTGFDITERKRIEEALIESEKKYRDLVDNADVGIYKTNLEGDILYVNEALSSLLEFESPDEMMAESAANRYKNPKVREVLIENLKKEGKIKNFDIELLTKMGKTKNVLLSATLGGDILSGMITDITERKLAEKELQELEALESSVLSAIPHAIIGLHERIIVFANDALEAVFGWKPDELIGKNTRILYRTKEEYEEIARHFYPVLERQRNHREEFFCRHKSGRDIFCMVSASRVGQSLKEKKIVVMYEDITERKLAEEALQKSEEQYRTLFEESRDAIYINTREGKFIDVNESMLDLFGYSGEEMIGLNARQIYVNPDDRERFQQEIEQRGSVRNFEVKFKKKDGTEMDCLLTSTVRRSNDGGILGYQGIIRDITKHKQAYEQLRYLSLHDPLTSLYNRTYFEEEMHRLENRRFDPIGLLICDIDGLKLVNDTLGHDSGDKLLLATAGVLRESFREGDMVARVGGDEFAILLPNSDRAAAESATHRIRDATAKYNTENIELPLSISIGFAISSETSVSMSDLFREADNNMYREKLQHSQSARSAIVQTLMKALEARDFITEGHATRLQSLVASVAEAIGLPERCINDLRLLAQFHDIGKVGLPDRILFKPDSLTREEYIEMQWHCEIGHRIALSAPDLSPIVDLILKHHEWWNGGGYPLGIKGEEIPIECRILAIADAYDAMTSDRPYRKAMAHMQAVEELKRCAGTQFDPDLVSRFIQVLETKRSK